MSILEKEISNNNNTFYASKSIKDELEVSSTMTNKLSCLLTTKYASIEVPVVKYSKSNKKILIDMYVKEKVLTDVILENILNLKIQLDKNNISKYSIQDYYLNFTISLFEDNIYKLEYELIYRK